MDAQATFSCSFTQSDLGPVTELPSGPPAELPSFPHWPAQRLLPRERRDLAVQVLAGAQPVSDLAREHGVSRKFVYQQVHTAQAALTQAFDPEPKTEKVLFYLPVTKAWLRQLVLALVLICHSSARGVVELLRDLFDYQISLGTVHNIVHSPIPHARRINQQYDLSTIQIGLLDEIFQADDPVLVGVDAQSTFCFLLSLEEHRDADTWGIRLLELVDRGFAPEATVADFASGLRAGHQEALPGCPCRGDVFHALYDVGPLVRYLENRAYEAIEARTKLEQNKPPPNVGAAARTRVLVQKATRTHGWLRPKRSRWLTRWRCWPGGCGTTFCRWLVRSTPSAVICLTSLWPSFVPASRTIRIGSGR